ncbi:hypothetical protein [Streptomyces sp. NPDC052036]|uniref:hypothetical protein n=1 Tax=Streptomyces sp. NPDC052036 TaxID=3155171 RepID=UPI003437DCF7
MYHRPGVKRGKRNGNRMLVVMNDMARKKKFAPGQRQAKEATRRAAAAERIGPRPPRIKSLHSLKPPGAWYEVWATPTAEFLARGPGSALRDAVTKYGADSQEAAALKVFIDHADIYGAKMPTLASAHLDALVRSSGMATTLAGSTAADEEEAIASVHRLHAAGTLLVKDDGAVWLTVPPGTPFSAPGGQWAFIEEKIPAPVPAD